MDPLLKLHFKFKEIFYPSDIDDILEEAKHSRSDLFGAVAQSLAIRDDLFDLAKDDCQDLKKIFNRKYYKKPCYLGALLLVLFSLGELGLVSTARNLRASLHSFTDGRDELAKRLELVLRVGVDELLAADLDDIQGQKTFHVELTDEPKQKLILNKRTEHT